MGRSGRQEAGLTLDMLKPETRSGGIAVRGR